MHLPAVLRKLYLRRDFYNTIFKLKHKLHTTSGSNSPQCKFWVRTWLSVYVADDGVRVHKEQVTTDIRRSHRIAKLKP